MQSVLRGDGAAAPVAILGNNGTNARNAEPRDDLDRARAGEYLLLANLLRVAPTAGFLADLSHIQGDATPLGLAHIGLADAARAGKPERIAREFAGLFIGVGRGDILPYGSYYLTGFLHERPLARLREDMERLGIVRQPNIHEPEDHIASVLEIMAGLVGGIFPQPISEADKFFTSHIASWAPRLMADVANAPAAEFYRAVGNLGRVFLDIEQEAMQLPG